MGHLPDQRDQDGAGAFPLAFSMAFQPIVDVISGRVFAHEALVRGVDGASADAVLTHLTPGNQYAFDQDSRVVAIRLAARLGLAAETSSALVSINFMPNAVADPVDDMRTTVEAARQAGLPLNRILLEFTEHEPVDPGHLQAILNTYRAMGFRTAIDDFGAGHCGLTLLSRFQPDVIKLDTALIRCIQLDRIKQTLVGHLLRLSADLGIDVAAEGIETREECETLRDLGVHLLQGFLFAKPVFEGLAEPRLPGQRRQRAA